MTIVHRLVGALVLLGAAIAAPAPATAVGVTYYVDNQSASCDDDGPGTSAGQPWCSFTPVNARSYGQGDTILLARGATWAESLDLTGSGTATAPITLGGYGSGAKPRIANTGSHGFGIRVTNGDHWIIKDLEVDGAGTNKFDAGVYAKYDTGGHSGLTLSNLYLHHNRFGLWVSGNEPAAGEWGITGVAITTIEGTHNEESIVLGNGWTSDRLIHDALISKVHLHDDDGAPAPEVDCRDALALQSATGVIVRNALITYAGGCYAAGGTTGVYLGHVTDSTLLNNIIVNTAQTGSPDQSGIVYQAGTTNVAVRGNYIGGHPRWSVEVLGIHPPPGGTHTGVVVDANAMAGNGSGQAIARAGGLSPATGAIDRNLWQGTSLTWDDGTTFTGFVIGGQGANPGPVTSDRLWYAARDFATGQGYQGWRYEYSTNASVTWTPLTFVSAGQGWRPTANGQPMINQWNMYPASGTSARVARAWTAPATGTIAITGQVAKSETGGDGVRVQVLKTHDGVNSVVLGPISIGANDLVGEPTAVPSLQVAEGDVIRFLVDAGPAGANAYDTVNWSPAIGYR